MGPRQPWRIQGASAWRSLCTEQREAIGFRSIRSSRSDRREVPAPRSSRLARAAEGRTDLQARVGPKWRRGTAGARSRRGDCAGSWRWASSLEGTARHGFEVRRPTTLRSRRRAPPRRFGESSAASIHGATGPGRPFSVRSASSLRRTCDGFLARSPGRTSPGRRRPRCSRSLDRAGSPWNPPSRRPLGRRRSRRSSGNTPEPLR